MLEQSDCIVYEGDTLKETELLHTIKCCAFYSFLSDLIHCTNEMNVNVPQLADTLFERTANSSWVVVFKALITTHHLMMYGNEVRYTYTHTCARRFIHYHAVLLEQGEMASSHSVMMYSSNGVPM